MAVGPRDWKTAKLAKLKDWARSVKLDVHAIYLAARDPRVPWYAKALALCVAAYALSRMARGILSLGVGKLGFRPSRQVVIFAERLASRLDRVRPTIPFAAGFLHFSKCASSSIPAPK